MLNAQDTKLLLDGMRQGEIVLFAGAGPNIGSHNTRIEQIKTGTQLSTTVQVGPRRCR